MKYFGGVAGYVDFYREEVVDSSSFPKRLWCSVVARLWVSE